MKLNVKFAIKFIKTAEKLKHTLEHHPEQYRKSIINKGNNISLTDVESEDNNDSNNN